MKKSKIFGAITAAALAALNLTAFAATPAFADEVDLDGTYHAYIGVQSASYTFRNAYDDATYGYGIVDEETGTVWFDQLTGWDGPTALTMDGTFTDCEIAGNGTYSVSMNDFDFGADETLNLLFVSTDIPLNDQIKVTDVKVIMDGNTKYTFDEAFMDPDAKIDMKWLMINIWNGDLGGADGLFGYMMPSNSIEVQFTISGFNYDNEAAAVEETTVAETEATTVEETTTAATEAETEAETTAAETEATTAATEAAAEASASAESSSSSALPIIIVIVAVVVVAAVVVFVVIKKKN